MPATQNYPPAVIWLTGLSAAGKTTIASSLVDLFREEQILPILLDGDEVRTLMNEQDFDEVSRKKHNRRIGQLSALLERQGHVVIVALISPYEDVRNEVRKCCKNFIEVYINTQLEICIQRDPKGLYKRAIIGDIKNFTGISAPYYAPQNPDISIDTSECSIDNSSRAIFQFYANKLKINSKDQP